MVAASGLCPSLATCRNSISQPVPSQAHHVRVRSGSLLLYPAWLRPKLQDPCHGVACFAMDAHFWKPLQWLWHSADAAKPSSTATLRMQDLGCQAPACWTSSKSKFLEQGGRFLYYLVKAPASLQLQLGSSELRLLYCGRFLSLAMWVCVMRMHSERGTCTRNA